MGQLVPGDSFPAITGRRADGSVITIPADLEPKPAVVICYRGHW